MADCPACGVEGVLVEVYDPNEPACAFGLPAESRCRLCEAAWAVKLFEGPDSKGLRARVTGHCPCCGHSLSDEELLAVRLCDLNVRIEGSELEPRVEKLLSALASRGLSMKPAFYLADEWLSPTGVPAIAIPFYLAHPRLKQLEMRQMMEVEGGTPE